MSVGETNDEPWERFLARARTEQPGLQCDDQAMASFMAPRLKGPAGHALDALCAGDLLFALAVLQGQPAAVGRFAADLRREVRIAAARSSPHAVELVDELGQELYERIALGAHGQPPSIRHFLGTGPLRVWLSVVVTRRLIDEARHPRVEQPLGPDLYDALASESESELLYFRSRYGDALKRAFERAVQQLEPSERNLFRYQLAGLTAAQVGQLRGLHRVTVAKAQAAARRRLAALTRDLLGQAIDAGGSEVDGLLNELHSRISLSLERLLQEQAPED